jgi:four helix bundle protein
MAKTFQELVAWQLARELRKQCIELTRRPSVRNDFQMRDQLRDASRSASRNIAEGFGRFSNKDFARFCRISKGSILELLDHFQDCFDSGYINAIEQDQLDHAARKALKAINGLIRFLEETPDPKWRRKPARPVSASVVRRNGGTPRERD